MANPNVAQADVNRASVTGSDFDVVIAGGGMVGASLALCLSRFSGGALRVLVVESAPIHAASGDGLPPYRPSFDARSTALGYGSRLIFEQLGIWSDLAQHACDIHTVHVSDRGHFGSVTLTGAEQGWPVLGAVIENPWLGAVLLSELQQAPGVSWRSPATLTEVSFKTDRVELALELPDKDSPAAGQQTPVSVSTALLVVADGAQSRLRQRLGIDTHNTDYRQTAFIANVATHKAHQGCAFERFTEYGALAFLPLTPDQQGKSRSALVWTFPREQAGAIAELSDADFLRRLQQDFGYRLGRLLKVGERVQFPLALTEATEQVRRQVVVMGNAAHSLHPVAGQGFNLALRDAASLARTLAAAKARGQALGELSVLQHYRDGQRDDQWLTTRFSDRLISVFGNRQPLLSVARNMGLSVLDVVSPVKSLFVAQTAGMAPAAGATMSRGQ